MNVLVKGRMMKQVMVSSVAVLAIFLAPALAQAQQPGEAAHSLIDGTWALQFAIADNLTLAPFAGGVVSAKHTRADGRALRYGISASGRHTSGRGDAMDRTEGMVGLVAHFLRYPTLAHDPGGNLQMFWGVGPLARFQHHRATQSPGDGSTFRALSLGASGAIGAEWFVRPRIGLTAEYQSALLASFLSDPAPDEWMVHLANEGVRFGISVYFR